MSAKLTRWLSVLWISWIGLLSGASVALALGIGDRAPDFSLPSTTGQQISLSQFRGKQRILLEFYGSDFAPTCGANLSARKTDYSEFQALNVQILGISTNHPFSQKMFADSLQLPFPLLSDFPDMKVTRQYGGLSLNATYARFGIAERAFFLIDKDGIVRQRWLVKGGEDIVFPTEPLLKAAQELPGNR
jgi:thioredoxin-dependent peroxiredoxin